MNPRRQVFTPEEMKAANAAVDRRSEKIVERKGDLRLVRLLVFFFVWLFFFIFFWVCVPLDDNHDEEEYEWQMTKIDTRHLLRPIDPGARGASRAILWLATG